MKKNKRLYVLVLSIVIVMTTFLTGVNAALPRDEAIMPLWTSIYEVEVSLNFSGTTGIPAGIASKQSTASSIEGTLTVYEEVDNEWIEVDSWYKRVTRGTLVVGEDFEATSGVRYKAVFYVVAYTGTTPESETFEIIKTCP